MKKHFTSIFCVCAAVVVMLFAVSYRSNVSAVNENADIAVKSVKDGVIAARFENLLNLNRCFDDDFNSDKAIIENSEMSLVNYAIDGTVNKNLVLNFVGNMYGKKANDFKVPASGENFVITPKGYSVYKHEILSVNETNGGFEVLSSMQVSSHDGEEYTVNVKSFFVANDLSDFGYNLLSCEICSDGLSI